MDERIAQNIQEERLLAFDKIVTACGKVLKLLGRPKYLMSVWNLWTQLAQSMYMLERHLWPMQAPETELHITLPPIARPLSDVMLDCFDEHAHYVLNAIEPMETFHQWFIAEYDTNLHSDFHAMMLDALLIFRAIEAMIRTKQRLKALLPASPQAALAVPAGHDAPPAHEAPSASAARPATGETDSNAETEMSITNAAGEVLSWY